MGLGISTSMIRVHVPRGIIRRGAKMAPRTPLFGSACYQLPPERAGFILAKQSPQ